MSCLLKMIRRLWDRLLNRIREPEFLIMGNSAHDNVIEIPAVLKRKK